MSQVFPCPRIGDQMSFAFQGFYERDRRTAKVNAFPHQLNMQAQIKNQPRPAVREEVPGLLTLNEFRSRYERGRFTQPMLFPRGLAALTPRRSEARPRWPVGRLLGKFSQREAAVIAPLLGAKFAERPNDTRPCMFGSVLLL
jgi:hypothetical protein